MRRIAIVGSRDYPDLNDIKIYIDELDPQQVMVISGGARGVDQLAVNHARIKGIHTAVIEALWHQYGKAAGYKRNRLIVDLADEVVAFHHNASRGTQHTIDIAMERGIPVTRITPACIQ